MLHLTVTISFVSIQLGIQLTQAPAIAKPVLYLSLGDRSYRMRILA